MMNVLKQDINQLGINIQNLQLSTQQKIYQLKDEFNGKMNNVSQLNQQNNYQ